MENGGVGGSQEARWWKSFEELGSMARVGRKQNLFNSCRTGAPRPSMLSIRMETPEDSSWEADHDQHSLGYVPWGNGSSTWRPVPSIYITLED